MSEFGCCLAENFFKALAPFFGYKFYVPHLSLLYFSFIFLPTPSSALEHCQPFYCWVVVLRYIIEQTVERWANFSPKCSVFRYRFVDEDRVKMNVDLKFDYIEALKRHNLTQSQVDVLRESAKKYPTIPKSLTNKQVIKVLQKMCVD